MRYVDLTHDLHPHAPTWPGEDPFSSEVLEKEEANLQAYRLPAGSGTHIDAPYHFHASGRRISELTLDELIGPGCIIPINSDADSRLEGSHIETFEREHGRIPEGALVLVMSGWCKRWNDAETYQNLDANGFPRCPHIALEAAEMLLERNIAGLGIDTLGPDNHPPYPVHKLMLPRDKFFIENLTRLNQLPPVGATIIALPLKVRGGAEASSRVIALVPD